ncbi:MAG TPA: hypothetical protein VGD75_16515 [Bradyrhizobium sp.]
MAPPLTGSSLIRNNPTHGSGQDQLAFELAAGAVPENIQRRAAQPTQARENLNAGIIHAWNPRYLNLLRRSLDIRIMTCRGTITEAAACWRVVDRGWFGILQRE